MWRVLKALASTPLPRTCQLNEAPVCGALADSPVPPAALPPPPQLEEPCIRSSRLRQLDAEQLAAAVEEEPPGGPGGAEFTVGGKKKKKGGSEGGGDYTVGGGGGGGKKGKGQVRRAGVLVGAGQLAARACVGRLIELGSRGKSTQPRFATPHFSLSSRHLPAGPRAGPPCGGRSAADRGLATRGGCSRQPRGPGEPPTPAAVAATTCCSLASHCRFCLPLPWPPPCCLLPTPAHSQPLCLHTCLPLPLPPPLQVGAPPPPDFPVTLTRKDAHAFVKAAKQRGVVAKLDLIAKGGCGVM